LALSYFSLYLRAFKAHLNAYRLNPNEVKVLVNVGQSLVHCSDKARALEYFKSDVKVLLVLHEYYVGVDRPDLVSKTLNRALLLEPNDSEVLDAYAKVLTRVSVYDKALAIRRRILRYHPLMCY
jgi:cytochrome c-type biogenesis protein CcmH/NrfG